MLGLAQVKTSANQSSGYRGMLMMCGSCRKPISPEPGDLIYGGQWYHLGCSDHVKESDRDGGLTIQERLLEEHRALLKL
jgi:hypothetical protein